MEQDKNILEDNVMEQDKSMLEDNVMEQDKSILEDNIMEQDKNMLEDNIMEQDKSILEDTVMIQGEYTYTRELTCKKDILECIELFKKQDKDCLSKEQWQGNYNWIYSQIEKLSAQIKPNTVVQLKNALKISIGKRVTVLDPVEENSFIEFFKEAYPEGKRRKDFTWVLADMKKISEDQILHTLKYISNWCTENRLTANQKEDIKVMLEKLVKRGNLKYINQVKSLEGLRKNKVLDDYIRTIGVNSGKKARKTYITKTNKK